MLNIIQRFLKGKEEEKTPVKMVFLGLDNAGKTTIMNWLKGKGFTDPNRTLGLDVTQGKEIEGFKTNRLNLSCWDIGGQESFRKLFWEEWGQDADACVFIIDANDKKRYQAAIKMLYKAISFFQKKVHLLILMNKMDILNDVQTKIDESTATIEDSAQNELLVKKEDTTIQSIMDKALIEKYLDDFVWELNMNPIFSDFIQTVQFYGTSAVTGLGLKEAFADLFQKLEDYELKEKEDERNELEYIPPLQTAISKITNVFVIHKSGLTMLSAGISSDEHDSMLLGGFLSAITDVAKKIFGSNKKTNFFPIGDYVIYSNKFSKVQIFVVAKEGINKRALEYVAKKTHDIILNMNIHIPEEGGISIPDETSKQFESTVNDLLKS